MFMDDRFNRLQSLAFGTVYIKKGGFHMKFKFFLLFLVLSITGCASVSPPISHEVTHDPVLRRGKVLLVTDVCIQRDCIGDSGDFFVIEESRYGAESCLPVLRSYLLDSDIQVCDEIFIVCGAAHGKNETIRVSQNSDGEITESAQPVYAIPAIMADREYLDALAMISTYAFEHPIVNNQDTSKSQKSAENPLVIDDKLVMGNIDAPGHPIVNNQDTSKSQKSAENPLVTDFEFSTATEIIRRRTGASSILFLGIVGNSDSGGKAFLKGAGRFLVGMGTGIATAGLGTGYYLAVIPGQKVSGRAFEGALIDLESGQLTWSNVVRARGNPIKKETWAKTEPLELLFHDVLFQKIATN